MNQPPETEAFSFGHIAHLTIVQQISERYNL
jgi:hypothetical protein